MSGRRRARLDLLVYLLGQPGAARDQQVALPISLLLPLPVDGPPACPGRLGHLGRGNACEQRPVHADRLPASELLGRHRHQRQLFEMVLRLMLVQAGRLR